MLHNTFQQENSSNVHIGDSVFNISRDVGILIYNRVPKSGSTTVNNILSDLSKRHRFSTFMSGAYASHSMPTSKAMCFHPYLLPDARIEVVTHAAMLPGLVLFKVCHISWKKEQILRFFQPKKNIFYPIFSKFFLILDNIFKSSWGGKNIFKVLPFCEVLED